MAMIMALRWTTALPLLAMLLTSASAFTTTTSTNIRSNTELSAQNSLGKFVASAILVSTLASGGGTLALADEYGVETEAPTLFTGESVMV
jgi:hypothetical protein